LLVGPDEIGRRARSASDQGRGATTIRATPPENIDA